MTAARRCAALVVVALAVLVGVPALAAPPQMSRDDIICRAQSGVGFSYYWGGACWCASGCSPNFSCSPGSCSGSCPSCTHHGTYGADCSGYVTKIWQVPDPIATTTCGHGPYVAATYTHSTSYWNVISRNSLQRGDSLASSTHVLIYEQGDPWGSLVAYEARGCSYGIVRNWRSCSSSYVAARRINLGSSCACTPGQTQSDDCGHCGTRKRTCQSDCQWGAWGSCGGQGPCAPGDTEARDCCDCGSQSRSCSGQCTWSDWTPCGGPDPEGGALACDTSEPGPCAQGRVRCVDGCQTCVRFYEPVAEVCDGVDNDCSGEQDDGQPTEMGATRPLFAASLVDSSVPGALGPGEVATVWAAFRNEGTATWQKGEIWLSADLEPGEAGSAVYDPESWPAYDVAAVLDVDVAPGELARFAWAVRAPSAEVGTATQKFRIMDPDGSWLRCPSPGVDVMVRTTTREVGVDETSVASVEPEAIDEEGCGCHVPSGSGGSTPWLLLVLLGWIGRLRREEN